MYPRKKTFQMMTAFALNKKDRSMGFLRNLFGSKKKPPPIELRDTLFGDLPLESWATGNYESPPWTTFASAREQMAHWNSTAAIALWHEVLAQPQLESRHYLQAWHFLRQHGKQPPPTIAKQLLGVVIEVGMPKGFDLLAAYADGSARYYNFSGAGMVWERPDDSLKNLIDGLLAAGAAVVARIGPWEAARPPAPIDGQVRLNFLTPSGLHFGQGPTALFERDGFAGPVMQAGMRLATALMSHHQKLRDAIAEQQR